MTYGMGPPPPRNPTFNSADSPPKTSVENSTSPSSSSSTIIFNLTESEPDIENRDSVSSSPQQDAAPSETANSTENNDVARVGVEKSKEQRSNSHTAVPYTIPEWSGPPCHPFFLEVLKDGAIIDQLYINEKGAYMFGRVDLCDFVLEHPTISRFHAVIQFKSNGDAYLYDMGSTHGTSINKKQVSSKVHVELHVGDVIRFGNSSRLYIFRGPTDLMPPEADLKSLKHAKTRMEMQDMEASLQRAKHNASLSDGISWGMQEDAVEEAEEDIDEITWQTYKGPLTEKQEKTREKVLKRLEKIAHMKKEIDAIRAKDIAQGGLTQGQQTQIARNEQRTAQILEELENLEETLNDSIRESIGARAGRSSGGRKKGDAEDGEDYYQSDDDEFYDRTKKLLKGKTGRNQSIETADSLLDKQEAIIKEMEEQRKLLLSEDKMVQDGQIPDAGDSLDAYMSAVSSALVSDNKDKLHKDLASLQSELDRVSYLLKIADPSGEAAKRRKLKALTQTDSATTVATSAACEQPLSEPSKSQKPEQQLNGSSRPMLEVKSSIDELRNLDTKPESAQKLKKVEAESGAATGETAVYTVAKPQWLGAINDVKNQEAKPITPSNVQENDQFVDYKDRKKILENPQDAKKSETSEIENAAPGLIIRKRKPVEKLETTEDRAAEQSKTAELQAEDAVALLLKHSRGYSLSNEDLRHDSEEVPHSSRKKARQKKHKKVLGPEKPTFMSQGPDYEAWVPPEGQSGDGRTSLNDRYGY